MTELTSKSPINRQGLSTENRLIYSLLLEGKKLTKFDVTAATPHSRFAEIRRYLSDRNITLQSEFVTRKNAAHKDVVVKEYWLDITDILKLMAGVEPVEKDKHNTFLANIEQSLIENLGEFLTKWQSDEFLEGLCDPIPHHESELHIRMAKAAMKEYKKTMFK